MPAKGRRKKRCGKCGRHFWCAPTSPVVCMGCKIAPVIILFFALLVLSLLLLSFLYSGDYGTVGFIVIASFVVFLIWDRSETNISEINISDKKDSQVTPCKKFSKTTIHKNTRSIVKQDTYLRHYDENKSTHLHWNVTRGRKPLRQSNTPQYTQEFDSKLLQMLEEARREGKTTCDIISKHLHNRVVKKSKINRMPMARNAMWKLWEQQGHHEERILKPRSKAETFFIKILFDT